MKTAEQRDQSCGDPAPLGSPAPRALRGGRGSGLEEPVRVKLMCSFGGRIVPRPHDDELRYVGGETRIVVVNRNVALAELLGKLARLFGSSLAIKYQMPSEDLDALVSVTSEEDLENMMEECDRLQACNRSSKLRLFLFLSEFGSQTSLSDLLDKRKSRDHWFVEALNGLPFVSSRGRSDTSSVLSEIPDYLFGFDGMDESTAASSQAQASSFEHLGSAHSQHIAAEKSDGIYSNPGSPLNGPPLTTIQFTSSAPPSVSSVASAVVDTAFTANPTKPTAAMEMDGSYSDSPTQQQNGTCEIQGMDESTGTYMATGLKHQPVSEVLESRDQNFLSDSAKVATVIPEQKGAESAISSPICTPYVELQALPSDLLQMEGLQTKLPPGEPMQQPSSRIMDQNDKPVDNLQPREQQRSDNLNPLPGRQVEFAETFYKESPSEDERQVAAIDSSDGGRVFRQMEETPSPKVPTPVGNDVLVQLEGFEVQQEEKMRSPRSAQELKAMQEKEKEKERLYAQVMDLRLETEDTVPTYATQPPPIAQKQVDLPNDSAPAVKGALQASRLTHQSPIVQPHRTSAPIPVPSLIPPVYSEGPPPLRAATTMFAPSSHIPQFSRQVSDPAQHLPRPPSPYRDRPGGHALHSRFRGHPVHLYPAAAMKQEGLTRPAPAVLHQSRVPLTPQYNDQIDYPLVPQVAYADPNVYARYGMQGPTYATAQYSDVNTFTDDILLESSDQAVSAIRYQEVLYDYSAQDHQIMMDAQHLQGRQYILRN